MSIVNPTTPTLPNIPMGSLPQAPSVSTPKLPAIGLTKYEDLDPQQSYYSATKTNKDYWWDTDDPEQINSWADIVYGTLNGNISWNDVKEFTFGANIAIKNTFETQGFKAGSLHALNNALVNFGETVDILANPVKALIPAEWHWTNAEEGSTVSERFKNATGQNGIRVSYNFATGNFFLDLIGETLSDPLNFIELGTKLFYKPIVKAGVTAGVKTAAESAELIGKNVALSAIQNMGKNSDDSVKAIARFTKSLKRNPEIIEAIASGNKKKFMNITSGLITGSVKDDALKAILTKSGLGVKDLDALTGLMYDSAIRQIKDRVSVDVLKGVFKTYKIAETIDKGILFAAGAPLVVPIAITKKVAPWARNFIFHKTVGNAVDTTRPGVGILVDEFDEFYRQSSEAIDSAIKAGALDEVTGASIKTSYAVSMQAASIRHQVKEIKEILLSAEDAETRYKNLIVYIKKCYSGKGKPSLSNYIKIIKKQTKAHPELKEYINDSFIQNLEALANCQKRDMFSIMANDILKNMHPRNTSDSFVVLQNLIDSYSTKLFDALKINDIDTVRNLLKMSKKDILEELNFITKSMQHVVNTNSDFLKALDYGYSKKELNELIKTFKDVLESTIAEVNYYIDSFNGLYKKRIRISKLIDKMHNFIELDIRRATIRAEKDMVKIYGDNWKDLLKNSSSPLKLKSEQIYEECYKKVFRHNYFFDMDSFTDEDITEQTIKLYNSTMQKRFGANWKSLLNAESNAIQDTYNYAYNKYLKQYGERSLNYLLKNLESNAAYSSLLNELFGDKPKDTILKSIYNLLSNNLTVSLQDKIDSTIIKDYIQKGYLPKDLLYNYLHSGTVHLLETKDTDVFSKMFKNVDDQFVDVTNKIFTVFDFSKQSALHKAYTDLTDAYNEFIQRAHTYRDMSKLKDAMANIIAGGTRKSKGENALMALLRSDLMHAQTSEGSVKLTVQTLRDKISTYDTDFIKQLKDGIIAEIDSAGEGAYPLSKGLLQVITDMNAPFDEDFLLHLNANDLADELNAIKFRLVQTGAVDDAVTNTGFTAKLDEFIKYITDATNYTQWLSQKGYDLVSIFYEAFHYNTLLTSSDYSKSIRAMFDISGDTHSQIGRSVEEFVQLCKDNGVGDRVIGALDELKTISNQMRAEEAFMLNAQANFADRRVCESFMQAFYGARNAFIDATNPTNIARHVIESTKINLLTRYSTRSFKIDELVRSGNNFETKYLPILEKRYGDRPEVLEQIKDAILNYGHQDPGSDIMALELIIEVECPKLYKRLKDLTAKGEHILLYDIESDLGGSSIMTTHANVGEAKQIAAKWFGSDDVHVLRIANREYEELSPYVRSLRVPELEDCASENDLLLAFERYWCQPASKLVGYNNSVFDTQFIKDRFDILHSFGNDPWGYGVKKATQGFLSELEEQVYLDYQRQTMSNFNRLTSDRTTHLDAYNEVLKVNKIPTVDSASETAIYKACFDWAANQEVSRSTLNPSYIKSMLRQATIGLTELSTIELLTSEGLDGYSSKTFRRLHSPLMNYVNGFLNLYDDFVNDLGLKNIFKGDSISYMEDLAKEHYSNIISTKSGFVTLLEDWGGRHALSYDEALDVLNKDLSLHRAADLDDAYRMRRLYDAFMTTQTFKDYFESDPSFNLQNLKRTNRKLYDAFMDALFAKMMRGDSDKPIIKTMPSGKVQLDIPGLSNRDALALSAYTDVSDIEKAYEYAKSYIDYDNFLTRTRNGRDRIYRMTDLWTPVGESSAYNISRKIDSDWFIQKNKHLHKFFDVFTYPVTNPDSLKRKVKIFETDLSRIKNIRWIFDNEITGPGLFKDEADLTQKLNAILTDFSLYNPNHWISFLHPDVINYTAAEKLVVLKSMLADKAAAPVLFKHLSKDVTWFCPSSVKDQQSYFIEWFYNNLSTKLFANGNAFSKLKDQMACPGSLLFAADFYEQLNIGAKVSLYKGAAQTLTNSDAKDFAIKQISSGVTKAAAEYEGLSYAARRLVDNRISQQFAARADGLVLTYMTKFINDPEYLLRHLLFNGGIMRFNRFNTFVPGLKINSYYKKLVQDMLNNVATYNKLGINVTAVGSDVWFYINKADDYLVDATFEGELYATYRGVKYKYFTRDERPIAKLAETQSAYNAMDDVKVVAEGNVNKFVNAFNKMLYFIDRSNTNYISNSRAITEPGLDKFIRNLPEPIAENFFNTQELISRGALRSLIYDNFDMSIQSFKDYNYYRVNTCLNDIVSAYRRHIYSMRDFDLLTHYLFEDNGGMDFLNEAGHFFYKCSDKDIAEVMQQESLIAVVVRKTKSVQGYDVKAMPIMNASDVAEARRLKASIVPYELYNNMYTTINCNADAMPKLLNNKVMRAIVLAYKIGYLAFPGNWIRNIIDSNLKAMIDTGDPMGVIKNDLKAKRYYADYNKTLRQIYRETGRNRIDNTDILRFFQSHAGKNDLPMEKDLFFMLKGFIENGPSAGEVSASIDAARRATKEKLAKYNKKSTAYDKLIEATSVLLKPMSEIEANVRLSEYLTLVEQGVLKSDAFQKVEHTAFNYAIKDNLTKYIEYIIPFYNFQKLNVLYWLDALEKHPYLYRLLDDYMDASLDSFNISQEDMEINRQNLGLAYHQSAGNIAFHNDTDDTRFVFKVNPSFIDAYNTILHPLATAQQSILAPITNISSALIPGSSEQSALTVGMLASGLQHNTNQGVGNFMDRLIPAIFNVDNVPILNVLNQKFFANDDPNTANVNEASSSKKNYKRLKDTHAIQARLGQMFPGIFGSAKVWEDYSNTTKYINTAKDFYSTNTFRKYTRPARHYNYYSPKRNFSLQYGKPYWYFANKYHQTLNLSKKFIYI